MRRSEHAPSPTESYCHEHFWTQKNGDTLQDLMPKEQQVVVSAMRQYLYALPDDATIQLFHFHGHSTFATFQSYSILNLD